MIDRNKVTSNITSWLKVLERTGARFVPEVIQQRYTYKFGVSLLLVVLVIAGVGGFVFQQAGATVERDTAGQLRETSALKAGSISEWVRAMRVQTRSTSASEAFQSDGPASAYLLQQQPLLSKDVISMHQVNTTRGTVVASTERPLEGQSLSTLNAPWTNASVPQDPGNSSTVWMSARSYQSPVLDDRPVMAFASSIPGKEGSYLVVISRIQKQLDRLNSAETKESTLIINGDGKTVLATDQGVSGSTHATHIQRARTTHNLTYQQGSNALHAYAPVEDTRWVAVTSVQKGDAFAVRDAVGRNIALLVLFALISLGGLGLVLARQTIRPLTRLGNQARRIEEGELNVDLSTRRKDEIGQLYQRFDSMRDSLQERIQEAEDALSEAKEAREEMEDALTEAEKARQDAENAEEEAMESREEAERVNQQLEQRADEYSDVMQECAAGDLTQRMTTDCENEAMADIAMEFNEMMEQIEQTVSQVMEFATDVAADSDEVAQRAKSIEATSETVSEQILSISDGTAQQNERLNRVSTEMDTLSSTIEEVSSSASEVAATAENAVSRGERGEEAGKAAIEELDAIEQQSTETIEQILDLEESIAQIGNIVEVITDIAEQTNVLALNASIEAKRAGAAGSGFGVVASEIKELATETKDAAEEIELLVSDIQHQTDKTVENIQRSGERVSEGVETVEETLSAIEEIVSAIEETNQGIQEINQATDEQADATQRVVGEVNSVTELSDEMAANAEQVSDLSDEQTSSVSEISNSADSLQQRAETLCDSLEEFSVGYTADAVNQSIVETDGGFESHSDGH